MAKAPNSFESAISDMEQSSGGGNYNPLLLVTAAPKEWGRFAFVSSKIGGKFDSLVVTARFLAGDFQLAVKKGVPSKPRCPEAGELVDFFAPGQVAKILKHMSEDQEFVLRYKGEKKMAKGNAAGKFKGKLAHQFDIYVPAKKK